MNPTQATVVTPFEATFRHNASVPSMTFGHFTHTLSPTTVWEARVGRYALDWNMDPSTGDRTTPNRLDRTTNVSSGNVPQFGQLLLNRVTAKAVLNHYRPGWLGGDHQMRAGTSFERGDHRGPSAIPAAFDTWTTTRQPFQAVYRQPSTEGGRFDTAALFASDTITIGDRFTVSAGLRFDHNRAVSQDIHASTRTARKPTTSSTDWARSTLKRLFAPARPHDEADRRRPDDSAGELRPVQPGCPHRRAQLDPPRRDADDHEGRTTRRRAATPRSCPWSIRTSTWPSTVTRARR